MLCDPGRHRSMRRARFLPRRGDPPIPSPIPPIQQPVSPSMALVAAVSPSMALVAGSPIPCGQVRNAHAHADVYCTSPPPLPPGKPPSLLGFPHPHSDTIHPRLSFPIPTWTPAGRRRLIRSPGPPHRRLGYLSLPGCCCRAGLLHERRVQGGLLLCGRLEPARVCTYRLRCQRGLQERLYAPSPAACISQPTRVHQHHLPAYQSPPSPPNDTQPLCLGLLQDTLRFPLAWHACCDFVAIGLLPYPGR